jgi:Flp pilus assembly protein TadG
VGKRFAWEKEMYRSNINNSEKGIATIEFAVTSGFFLMMIVAVVAGGHFFWTHNALVEATRRGARYAANQCNPADTACTNYDTAMARIKNMVIYNSPTAGSEPFVPNLTTSNVTVTYSKIGCADATCKLGPENFGVSSGTVTVRIQGYDYNFILSPVALHMPPYETTVRGESAGWRSGQNLCP